MKAIDPFAKAANGLPEGARVTERVSTISTYSSLLVWRTLPRRHGIAGPLVVALRLSCLIPPEGRRAGDELLNSHQSKLPEI